MMVDEAREGLSVYLAGGVRIPPRLHHALEAGRLVLFVGAGASLDPDSSLPDFEGLTAQLLKLAGSAVPLRGDKRFDVQLGDLADSGFPVHEGVRQIIRDPNSKPNRWHKASASLFESPSAARVVTTNYDLHLETALGGGVTVWHAPALPLGHSFRGVVHLHGSLSGEDNGYVVTDGEFGRAYMTEGWARRFVISVLREFHVLFIGYSHDDLVMQYLARGLPPDRPTKRWALVSPNNTQQWDRYRIDPLPWDIDASDEHGPGVIALRDWGKKTWWTPLQHEERIRNLIAGGPLLDPVDENYLDRVLEHDTRSAFFCQQARGIAWLDWASKQEPFKGLFRRDRELSLAQHRLAAWFADEYAATGTGDPLGVLADAGGELSEGLWRAIARGLSKPGNSFAGDRDRWLIILLNSAHKDADDTALNYIFSNLHLPQDRNAVLLLLRALFQPRVQIRSGLALPGYAPQLSVEITVPADEHWVDQVCSNVLIPNVGSIDADVYEIATSLLTEHHQIYVGFGQGSETQDPMNWQRSAIEPHAQDRHNDAPLRLVDFAREAAKSLATQVGSEEISRNLMSRRTPLLTRLAVWIMAEA